MKRRALTYLLTATLIAGLFSACGNTSTTGTVTNPTNNSNSSPEVICLTDTVAESVNIDYTINSYDPVNSFGYRLFQENLKGTTNPVLSPVSAYIALTMAGNGANGTTKEEFLKLLGENGEMTSLSDDMMNSFSSNTEKLKLNLANSAWIDDELTPNQEWLNTISSLYDAQAYHADLSTADAMDAMNQWVSEHTQGLINKMIEKPLDEKARLVLFNTLYFKSVWRDPFMHEMTYDQTFTTTDGEEKDVPMMHQNKVYFDYLSDDQVDGVILPYAEGNLAFVALKSKNESLIRDYCNNLTVEDITKLINQKQESTYMNLSLPKFDITFDQELNQSLINMGLQSAFDEDKADFTDLGTTEKGGNLYISLVRQKANIKLDEEGTEAAAATEVAMFETTSLDIEQPLNITFDQPFLYMIMDMENQVPLFIGIIDDPSV